MRRLMVLLKNILALPKRLFSHISVFAVLQESKVDKTAAICSGVRFYRSKIGKYSYIGNNSFVADTNIGNFTSIAADCYIGGAAHPLTWISTSPVFHKWENIMKKNFARHDFEIFARTTIGNDVWIGNRTMIKAGITVGDGAVIGMGSILTKDVGPYEIWAGNPARLIRKRFDDDIIDRLITIKWWHWDDQRLAEHAHSFNDVNEFLENERA